MRVERMMVLAAVAALCGFARAEGKTVKVLAVGNSFSANALKYFSGIVTASGNRTVAKNAMIGGCDFERHMRHADAFESNPNDPEGRPYPGSLSLKDLLTLEKWDFVTIQQASHKSFKPETFHPHADRLIAYIKKYAPQAEVVIHETWAYRDDHTWFAEREKHAGQPDTTDVMYTGVRAAYDGLAKDTGFRLIPCGDAVEAARRDQAFGKAGKHTLSDDCFHANAAGEYLLGCVWHEFFFGQSVVGNTCVPKSVAAADAVMLQRIAHEVVTEKKRPEPK